MNEKRCDTCKHYSALREPRERPDGAIIYGYCFKSGDKDYSPYMGKGYPIFLDGGGCACKEYKRKNAPAADVEPVRHGRWYFAGDGYCRCSECGQKAPICDYGYNGVAVVKSLFCPQCGATMDGEAEDLSHETA